MMLRLHGHRRNMRILFCVTVAITLVGGCTSGPDEDTPKPGSNVEASEICGGILDPSAAAALQRLSGTDRFDEGVRVNNTGEAKTFSANLAAGQLYKDYGDRDTCSVYKADDSSGHPFITIEFTAINRDPSASHKSATEKWILYPIGSYARAGRLGADIYFHCPTKAPKEANTNDAEYAKAEMYAPIASLRGDNQNTDRMIVLNSAARAVAKAAGCADEAALPAKVPAPKTS